MSNDLENISILKGTTAFLNGEVQLHEQEQKFANHLESKGHKILVLDDLYDKSEKLTQLIECENMVVQSTGMFPEKNKGLIKQFYSLNYIPKVVIFASEQTAMTFLSVARMLKPQGTKFYYYSPIFKDELQEVIWI